MSAYVFPNYYGSAQAQSLSALAGRRCSIGCLRASGDQTVCKIRKERASPWTSCLIRRPFLPDLYDLETAESVYVYVAFYTLAFVAIGFFNMIIWAMITDVIDDAEVKNGVREDGTIYSVYSFARKIGQALSSGMVGGLLSIVGYTEATAFDPEVVNGIFNISCIVPIIGMVAVALALLFIYPLNKKRVDANIAELKKRRGEV